MHGPLMFGTEEDYEELIQASPVLGFLPKSSLSASAIRELMHG
jgi:hypothetical protein